jgi:hypothetical protein
MRGISKQKRPIAFISGKVALLYDRNLLNIDSSNTFFKPIPPFGFFLDLLNKFREKSIIMKHSGNKKHHISAGFIWGFF